MLLLKKLKEWFSPRPKKTSPIDDAILNLVAVGETDWNRVYSSDFKNSTLFAYYKDVGIYCKALKYILECFENRRAVSVYYVNSETQESYLSEWFLSDGNMLPDVNKTVQEFLSMAALFLEQYQEMEANVSSTEQLTVERNLQLTRTLVGDLVNLASQLKHFMV